jgi:hypothetical protein
MVQLKNVNVRASTPKKGLSGGRPLPLALWQENPKVKKAERAMKEIRSFNLSGDENESEEETKTEADYETLRGSNREAQFTKDAEPELELDMVSDEDLEEDGIPAPEKFNLPLDSDFDYYSTIPSPTGFLYSEMIRTEDGCDCDEGVPDFECDSPYDKRSFLWGNMSPARSVDLNYTYSDDSIDGRSSGFADMAFLDCTN